MRSKEEVIEELRYFRMRVENMQRLDHRSNCPICNQSIPFNPAIELKIAHDKIMELEEELKPINAEIQKQLDVKHQKDKEQKKFNEIWASNVENMKCIKQQFKKVAIDNIITPLSSNLSRYEQLAWNSAMSKYIDTPKRIDYDDHEDLFYKII